MGNPIKALPLILLYFVLTFTGCADKIVDEQNLSNENNANSKAELSKLSEIQKQVLTPFCATSGCHSGNQPQANLNLSEGKSYSNLVSVQSFLYPASKRVQPGNKEESIFYKVLTYNFTTQMPPNGKISQSFIDSIGVWIDKGASNN